MKKHIFIKIILIVLTVLVMIFIYRMSAMEAEESSQLSTSVGYTVGEIVIEGFEQMPAVEQERYVDVIEHPLRKLAHYTEFAVLGLLLLFDVVAFTGLSGLKRFFAAVVIGLLYAATDELHQILVSGRSCEIRDVLIDTGGVVSGCLAAAIIVALYVHFHNKKEKSS